MSVTKPIKLFLWVSMILWIILVPGCETFIQPGAIEKVFPASGDEISAFGWVGVSFSQPMKTSSVEEAFSISPDVQGEFIWQGDAFWFRPIYPYQLEIEYQARLIGNLETAGGQIILIDRTWAFTIREPQLIYFMPQGEGGEIWRANSDGRHPQPLSFTRGNVFEFSPDRTGAKIAFSVQNDYGGRDLWVMDREGKNQRKLIDCGRDVCDEAVWSMDGEWIAYTRKIHQLGSGSHQPAQVWTVQVDSGETNPLYQSDIAFGHSPSFSPDGKKLATYDTNHNAIRLLDLGTSHDAMIPSGLPGSGDWSPDGSKIIFTDVVPAENEPFVVVYVADLAKEIVKTAFERMITDTDFSQPCWSPDGEWVAVSLRPVNAAASKALWVLHLDGSEQHAVIDEPSSTFSAYQWDPWGERLIYQRFELGRSDNNVSIWCWDWETRSNTLIIENGARPQWLP